MAYHLSDEGWNIIMVQLETGILARAGVSLQVPRDQRTRALEDANGRVVIIARLIEGCSMRRISRIWMMRNYKNSKEMLGEEPRRRSHDEEHLLHRPSPLLQEENPVTPRAANPPTNIYCVVCMLIITVSRVRFHRR